MPFRFSRSSVKFQGHTAKKKSSILTQIGHFRTVTPVWIHQWLWNDAQSLKQHRRGALLFFKVIHQISRSHGLKNWRFESNLRLLGRSQLSNPSDSPCFNSNSLTIMYHTRLSNYHHWPFMRGIHGHQSPGFSFICHWYINSLQYLKLKNNLPRIPVKIPGKTIFVNILWYHNSDIIMKAMASGVSIVCSAVCSSADQRKHQSFALPAFMRRNHRWSCNGFPPQKASKTEMFPFDGEGVFYVNAWIQYKDVDLPIKEIAL